MVSAISRVGDCLAAGGVYLVSLDSDGRVRAGTEPTRQEALGLVWRRPWTQRQGV
jgi:hypothetical protein